MRVLPTRLLFLFHVENCSSGGLLSFDKTNPEGEEESTTELKEEEVAKKKILFLNCLSINRLAVEKTDAWRLLVGASRN